MDFERINGPSSIVVNDDKYGVRTDGAICDQSDWWGLPRSAGLNQSDQWKYFCARFASWKRDLFVDTKDVEIAGPPDGTQTMQIHLPDLGMYTCYVCCSNF